MNERVCLCVTSDRAGRSFFFARGSYDPVTLCHLASFAELNQRCVGWDDAAAAMLCLCGCAHFLLAGSCIISHLLKQLPVLSVQQSLIF